MAGTYVTEGPGLDILDPEALPGPSSDYLMVQGHQSR